jgi:prophage regulatory protein
MAKGKVIVAPELFWLPTRHPATSAGFRGMPMAEKFLRRPEVEKITGLPRSSIYERMAAGHFPKSVPLGGRSVAWLEAEIIVWQKKRIADRDRKRSGCP